MRIVDTYIRDGSPEQVRVQSAPLVSASISVMLSVDANASSRTTIILIGRLNALFSTLSLLRSAHISLGYTRTRVCSGADRIRNTSVFDLRYSSLPASFRRMYHNALRRKECVNDQPCGGGAVVKRCARQACCARTHLVMKFAVFGASSVSR